MGNILQLREYKKRIVLQTTRKLSNQLSAQEKVFQKHFHQLAPDATDEQLDNALLDFFSIKALAPSLAAHIDQMGLLNTGVCPLCGNDLIGKRHHWQWKDNLTKIYICEICYTQGTGKQPSVKTYSDYSRKDIDKLFMMLSDLYKDRKPGFFTSSQYKDLYNHPLKLQIQKLYLWYISDVNYLKESVRQDRVSELINVVYNHQLPDGYLERDNKPF
jgi:hypothetical protein